ncbi:MAG: amidohydrolase [Gammaproteobacteria bacterium]|nr:amidohydrolase [Gammaproteobacteria bacterium]
MIKKILSLAFLAATFAGCDSAPSNQPDAAKAPAKNLTLLTNAVIYTSNDEQPTATALAIQSEKFVGVGSTAELLQQFPQADQVDMQGRTVIPGLIDAHVHLLSLGQALSRVDLVGSTDKADILQRLQAFAATLPEGQWLLGRGWDQNDWPVKELPTAADLDAAFPDRPIWLTRIDGHAAWANSAAMAYADQDLNGDWQPDGGEIVRDASGQASGVFIDNAETLIASKIPAESVAQQRAALNRAMQKTASVGLTSVHNAGTSKQVWDILEPMHAAGELAVRYYAMADGSNEMLDYLCAQGAQIDPSAMLSARAVKLYSDGALGSRGAALLEDYSDRPGQRGLLIEPPATLKAYATRAAECGLQINIHAIGDRGNRVTLDALAAASNADNPGRHRVEHAQVISAEDFARFNELDLIASVQPTHATSDMYWAEQRVGAERIKGAYAWQTFNDLGVPLALGSDFPVEKADPLLGFYAAVSRQDTKGWPEGGWYPTQTLTRQQALHGFTLGAAYAAFEEDKIGSIEAGKYADFVVLEKDIMQIPAAQIPGTKILQTWLNGAPIYSAKD